MAQTRGPREDEFISGYPAEMCDVAPGEKLLCCACGGVLRRAEQTPCGHRYCGACRHRITRIGSSPACPRCVEDPSCLTEDPRSDSFLTEGRAFSDTSNSKEISELREHCVMEGCSWSGAQRDYESHHCEETVSKDGNSRKSDPQTRGKISDTAECRFSSLGCSYRGRRDKMKEHERAAAAAHVSMLLPALQQIQSGGGGSAVTENGLYEQNGDGRRLPRSHHSGASVYQEITTDCSHHNGGDTDPISRICALETRIQVAENIITVMNREIEVSSTRLSAVLEHIEEEQRKVQSCEAKIADLCCTLAKKEVELNDLHIQLETREQTSHDGIFLWRISELTRKCQEAIAGRTVSLYSPAFYTARYGYKVCLRVYLNGDGAGRGSHISLFFAIMRGDYDVLLPWPFKHKVTFMLLDQSNREHVIDAFRPDHGSVSFQRPTSDMNIASGCPLFCPLSKLQAARNNYVRDDTIFIRCIIDPNV